MDSRERDGGREVDFREADRRYAELKRRLDAGTISNEEFAAHRQQLMVQDDEGRWWAKLGESGEWYYHDGSTWVQGTPPGNQEVVEPTGSPAQTPSTPYPEGAEDGENGRRKVAHWIPVAGVVGITLVVILLTGIALVYSVLIPYLQGESASGNQGEPMQAQQDEPEQAQQDEPEQAQQDEPEQAQQEEPAPDQTAVDAVFIHRATSENISFNSTYIDNPQTNGTPDAILYVTQNWNPGESVGTYNNHPIGVWYDGDRGRWAIFNQDREAMPNGAAFNVAVLEDPPEER
jgi:hypothetical protein